MVHLLWQVNTGHEFKTGQWTEAVGKREHQETPERGLSHRKSLESEHRFGQVGSGSLTLGSTSQCKAAREERSQGLPLHLAACEKELCQGKLQ